MQSIPSELVVEIDLCQLLAGFLGDNRMAALVAYLALSLVANQAIIALRVRKSSSGDLSGETQHEQPKSGAACAQKFVPCPLTLDHWKCKPQRLQLPGNHLHYQHNLQLVSSRIDDSEKTVDQ